MNTQTLIKARKRAKISQTEAANYLSMVLRTFQRKENSETFTLEEGLKYCQLLGIEVLFYTKLSTQ